MTLPRIKWFKLIIILTFPYKSSSRRSCRCRDKIHDLLFQFFLIYSKKHFHFFHQLLFLIWWFTLHSFPFQPIFQSDSVHFIQLKWEILHFYTRGFLKFSMDTENERWREWVNEKLHSTPITHSESAIKTSIKWVEYVQSRQ